MLCRSEPCKYHGWLLLEEWCRHPAHLEPLKPGRICAMLAAGGKCPSFIDWEAKVMPGTEPPWPMPIVMQQLIAVIAVSICGTPGIQSGSRGEEVTECREEFALVAPR